MKKKYTMTLLEIMVVIFIIGIISTTLAWNLQGTMKKSKKLGADEAAKKIADILILETELQGLNPQDGIQSTASVEKILRDSGMVKDVKKLMKDQNGQPFQVTYDAKKNEYTVKQG